MVESLNLKGHNINGAMISREHGGIIVNTGEASGEDIFKLATLIKTKVRNHFNINIELEQVLI